MIHFPSSMDMALKNEVSKISHRVFLKEKFFTQNETFKFQTNKEILSSNGKHTLQHVSENSRK